MYHFSDVTILRHLEGCNDIAHYLCVVLGEKRRESSISVLKTVGLVLSLCSFLGGNRGPDSQDFSLFRDLIYARQRPQKQVS